MKDEQVERIHNALIKTLEAGSPEYRSMGTFNKEEWVGVLMHAITKA